MWATFQFWALLVWMAILAVLAGMVVYRLVREESGSGESGDSGPGQGAAAEAARTPGSTAPDESPGEPR